MSLNPLFERKFNELKCGKISLFAVMVTVMNFLQLFLWILCKISKRSIDKRKKKVLNKLAKYATRYWDISIKQIEQKISFSWSKL